MRAGATSGNLARQCSRSLRGIYQWSTQPCSLHSAGCTSLHALHGIFNRHRRIQKATKHPAGNRTPRIALMRAQTPHAACHMWPWGALSSAASNTARSIKQGNAASGTLARRVSASLCRDRRKRAPCAVVWRAARWPLRTQVAESASPTWRQAKHIAPLATRPGRQSPPLPGRRGNPDLCSWWTAMAERRMRHDMQAATTPMSKVWCHDGYGCTGPPTIAVRSPRGRRGS